MPRRATSLALLSGLGMGAAILIGALLPVVGAILGVFGCAYVFEYLNPPPRNVHNGDPLGMLFVIVGFVAGGGIGAVVRGAAIAVTAVLFARSIGRERQVERSESARAP